MLAGFEEEVTPLAQENHDPIASQPDPPPWEDSSRKNSRRSQWLCRRQSRCAGCASAYRGRSCVRDVCDHPLRRGCVPKRLRKPAIHSAIVSTHNRGRAKAVAQAFAQRKHEQKESAQENGMFLESIRKKLSVLVEQEIKRIQEQSPKAN